MKIQNQPTPIITTEAEATIYVSFELRWSHFVGQFSGDVKVYSGV